MTETDPRVAAAEESADPREPEQPDDATLRAEDPTRADADPEDETFR